MMKKMRKRTGFFCLLALFLFATGCQAQAGSKESVLDFSLQDLQDKTVTLVSFRQKGPVLIFFWTTWCAFCRKELEVLNTQQSALKDVGIFVLAVNAGESQARVARYFQGKSPVYPVLLDKDMSLSSSWGIRGVPTYIIVNKKGQEVFRGHSFPADTYKEFRE